MAAEGLMTQSRLSVFSDAAQIISALGVVVSLLYVGYEIRQNTGAPRAATRQAVAETDLAFVAGPLDPALLARAESKRVTGQELTGAEELVLYERQHLNFRVFENAHYQFEIGLLEAEVWGRHLRIIESRLTTDPFAAAMWASNARFFTESFRAVVDSISGSMGSP